MSDSHDQISKALDEYFERKQALEDPYETAEFAITALLALEGKGADAQPGSGSDVPPRSVVHGRHREAPELAGHLKRVAAFAKLLALKIGLDENEAEIVKWVSPMHDIGKGAIPDSILKKPGQLTPEEFEIMKTHTLMGYDMLKNAKQEIIKLGALIAIQHQEKFDGSGYPNGLKGGEIHLYSRITTVADVFDALGSERSYKKAWSMEDIIGYFRAEKGRHFDPRLVDALLDNLEEFLSIREAYPV